MPNVECGIPNSRGPGRRLGRWAVPGLVALGLLSAAGAQDAPTPAPALPAGPVAAEKLPLNRWVQLDVPDGTPTYSPGLVWLGQLKRFIGFMGRADHEFKGSRPYDVQSFDLARGRWVNDLPAGATTRGEETGPVTEPGYNTPWFAMTDKEGLVRPHPAHSTLWHQYAFAPWDGCIYILTCGRLLRYDPGKRIWQELKPANAGPVQPTRTAGEGLCWASLCADPVNREIVLFGGCGLLAADGSPGTWAYATEKNEWREVVPAGKASVQPLPRALSPMTYDAGSRKIVLFGGEGLSQLYADTWLYHCATRTWSEAKPAVGPAPRFGHALLALPRAGRVILLGGKTYNSSTGYLATLYQPLPFEMWSFDVAKNEWSLIARPDRVQAASPDASGRDAAVMAAGPPQHPTEPAVVAVNDDDVVLMLGPGARRYQPHATWVCRIDAGKPDAGGTARFGVEPGTLTFRTGSFDPEWYSKDVPPPDPAAIEAFFKDLPTNRWLAIKCPKWPENRQGGGWSTATLDTVNDQVLQMGGGHSSYFGNDVTHFDIRTGRWSIACRPQFALEFNYGLNGPGLWAFNGAPWGNHNYHAYTYDATLKRIVYIKGSMTIFYDPVTRTWPFEEKFGNLPFYVSKYVNYLCPTPGGTICWTQYAYGSSRTGLWRLEGGRSWKEIKLSGDPLPLTVCDGSTICYDSKRDRLVMTTTPGGKDPEPVGQVWAADLKTGQVSRLNPTNMAAVKSGRFARESAYIPSQDLVMIGYILDAGGKLVQPFYDCDRNRWLVGELPGQEFLGGRDASRRPAPGGSVDLGLAHDPKRDVVWGVLCSLRADGALNVIRVDKAGLVEPR